jgi:hypothetical protein
MAILTILLAAYPAAVFQSENVSTPRQCKSQTHHQLYVGVKFQHLNLEIETYIKASSSLTLFLQTASHFQFFTRAFYLPCHVPDCG